MEGKSIGGLPGTGSRNARQPYIALERIVKLEEENENVN